MNNLNLTFITNIYTPYREKQFSLIKKAYPNLKVYFTGDQRENRLWNSSSCDYFYQLEALFNIKKFGTFNLGLNKIVGKSELLILGGYEQPSYIYLSLLCKIYKKPYILLYDGISPLKTHTIKKNWKYFLKKFVISNASSFWVNGTVSYEYFNKCFNINKHKIYNQYLTIEKEPFQKYLEKKQAIKQNLKDDLNIKSDSKVILYSGRFIKRKHIKDIFQALSKLDENKKKKLTLILIGDENQDEILKFKLIAKKYMINLIIGGFIQQKELYKYYFLSDLLILPSSNEPWGLVVNEAVYSQIPIVVSDECGSSLDLVKNGKNGYIYSCGNIEQLKVSIENSLQLDLKTIQSVSKEISKEWNFNNSLNQLNYAINLACVKDNN